MKPLKAILASMIAVCVSTTAVVLAEPAKPGATLKVNDQISVEVFGEAELNTQTRILRGGNVMLPLIGNVQLEGLTVKQANDLVTSLYEKDFLVDPKVRLNVDQYSPDFVTVTGCVARAASVPLPAEGKLDLATVVAAAGGVTPDADPQGIRVTSASGGAGSYSLAALQSNSGVYLHAGDRVTIARSPWAGKKVMVMGQVGKQGAVPFPVTGKLDLVAAVAQAGGCTTMANPKKVSVQRDGKTTTYNLKEMIESGAPSLALSPDDYITIHERLW